MEGYEYDDAAASTGKIEDIANDEVNREILRRLKDNDPDFVEMWVRSRRDDEYDYCPEGPRDLALLGYYIGKNTILEGLYLRSAILFDSSNSVETFFRWVNSNRSIQKIELYEVDLSGGGIFRLLCPFFEDNLNLSKLEVEECEFGTGCARQLTLALKGCNKSLKSISVSRNRMGEDQLAEIIEALSTHTQLEKLELVGMNAGRNECGALTNALHSMTRLQELNLRNNTIDDDGVDALIGAIANSRLQSLNLSSNHITARGCRSLAGLLEQPKSNLEELHLGFNIIGDEGALILANALANNRKLKTLNLHSNGFTAEGWSCFSKVLRDTSSVNNTFLSNHTLESLGGAPSDVASSLALNRSSEDKRQVAMEKILKHHRHFDMQPFFEWDLKVLHIAIGWFERARSIEGIDEAVIDKRNLEAIYQFIRAMPEVFEPAPAVGDKRKRIFE